MATNICPVPSDNPNLTKRQLEVLDGIARGLPWKAIGNRQTIANHRKEILRKLDVGTTVEAAVKAVRLGII